MFPISSFDFHECDIPGVYLINSFWSEDNRGIFTKSFEKDIFEAGGVPFSSNEVFYSTSSKYVIRGMHFQTRHPQAKLVGVIRGRVFDVVVDLRESSPTFGQWRGFYLSELNRNSLLIPRNCAHGFISLSDDSIVSYNCDGAYEREYDSGIRFDDPDIAVEWPINKLHDAILSTKDRKLMSFQEFRRQYHFEVM